MENERNVAKEIGNRCKRARNALGWSQQTLAEKIGMSTQNISKLEKNGISNINDILRLSEILGVDLQNDERDIEGSFGEVGKEILGALIKNHGYLDFENLVRLYMLGMNKNDVSKEIRKLSSLWFCVREVYKDFDEDECDGIFITAKGIMAYKNSVSPVHLQEVADELSETVSYEKRIGQAQSYQDWIDSRPWEKKIRELRITNAYRAGYVRFLNDTFTTAKLQWTLYDKDVVHKNVGARQIDLRNKNVLEDKTIKEIFPGISFHFDACHQLAIGTDKDEMESVVEHALCRNEWAPEMQKGFVDRWYSPDPLTGYDPLGKESLAGLHEFPELNKLDDLVQQKHEELENDIIVKNQGNIRFTDTVRGEEKKLAEELIRVLADVESKTISNEAAIQALEKYATKVSLFPDGYYSQEIPEFVKKNYPPASSESEKQLDQKLSEINHLYPPTVLYYYGDYGCFEGEESEKTMRNIRRQYGIEDPVFTESELEDIHEIRRENTLKFESETKW